MPRKKEKITYSLKNVPSGEYPTQEQFEDLMGRLACYDLSVGELLDGLEDGGYLLSIATHERRYYPNELERNEDGTLTALDLGTLYSD